MKTKLNLQNSQKKFFSPTINLLREVKYLAYGLNEI